MKKKLHTLKLVFIVFAGLVIILAAAFLITSYKRMSDKKIPAETFYNRIYITQDNGIRLAFGENFETVNLSLTALPLKAEYKENILTLSGAVDSYSFIVIDEKTMYSSATGYMFFLGEY